MKKGFVFIETIIVLMIVTMSLTLLFASYTLIKAKSQEKENYDKISDKYLLYAISNLGTNASYNYGTIADYGNLIIDPKTCGTYDKVVYQKNNQNNKLEAFDCKNYVFDKCTEAKMSASSDVKTGCEICQGYYNIFSPKATKNVQINTSSFTKEDTSMPNCQKVFTELDVVRLYVINDVREALKSANATQIYDNGTINYLKTLRKCYDSDYASEGGIVKDDENIGVCNDPVRYLVGVFNRYDEYFFASIEI